jgi:uncharacterized protein (TIGR02646 family)
MIPVVRPTAPAVLLTKGVAATQELCKAYASAPDAFRSGARTFEDFDKSIYAANEVKDALRDAQHNKCAFCESFVPHTGYGDVEHFRPKAGYKQRKTDELKRPGYYWLAYAWDNLFYSCQLCNQRFKQNLFPLKDGRRRARSHTHDLGKEHPLLVDPSRLDPAVFVEFHEERARAIDGCPEGETTIEVLGLNRPELVEARARRLQTLKALLDARNVARDFVTAASTPELSNRLRALEVLLRASREATGEYAAMARAFG